MLVGKRLITAMVVIAALLLGAVTGIDDAGAFAHVTAVDVAVSGTKMWRLTSDGKVLAASGAGHHGDVSGMRLNGAPRGIVPTPTGNGYWILGADGGIFSFGDASFHGSTGAMRLNQPVVGMAATPTGGGYWLVAGDGGIFSFGDAVFYGSTGGMRLNRPVVGMAATPTGAGYWLVASDGGVFTFGDAAFYGSTGGMRLNAHVNAMAATPTGNGYWLVASDGGVFTFGDASFHGSAVGRGAPAVSVARVGSAYVQMLDNGIAVEWPSGATGAFPALPPPPPPPRPTPPPPPVTGPHSFLYPNTYGNQARWDPCRPVRIVVNWAGSHNHANARATLNEAVARVRAASGLDLRIVGETTGTGVPVNAEILIHWAGSSVMNGNWGLAWVAPTKVSRLAWARIAFSSQVTLRGGFGTGTSFGNLALHELGHAVGLGHVSSTSQVMNPVIRALPGYGNGDREGLWRVGAPQGCHPAAMLMSPGDDEPTEVITIVN